MKWKQTLLAVLPVIALTVCVWAQNVTNKEPTMNDSSKDPAHAKKVLVAYFSHTGHTRTIANQIHDIVGGDLYEIVSVAPYPTDYDTVVEQAKREQQAQVRPALKSKLKDAQSYDIIFVGYPNWWGSYPMPVATFLTENDFSGKTIIPFCTHEGSRLGRSVSDLKQMCPKSKVVENGLAVRGRSVGTAQSDVAKWLKSLGF
jgi:flavodoxin